MYITRVTLLIQVCLFTTLSSLAQNFQRLQEELVQLSTISKNEIGIALVINSKDTLVVNNDVHYPLMSVFKLHQAIAVCHTLEEQHIPLDSIVHVKREELAENTYSPLRDRHPQGNLSISIKELLEYTLLLSDNNACDILFNHIIDVKSTNAYLQSLTTAPFSLVATEKEMHANPQLCYANWSTPLSTVQLLEGILNQQSIKGAYRSFIIKTMLACQTGQNRLPKFIKHKSVQIGHKTGTSDKNAAGEIIAVNDAGFIILPNGAHYTIAVFVKDSNKPLEETEKIIATVSNRIYAYLTTHLH